MGIARKCELQGTGAEITSGVKNSSELEYGARFKLIQIHMQVGYLQKRR